MSEEVLGFIQGYAVAVSERDSGDDEGLWLDDIRKMLSPDLDDDAVFDKAMEEAVNRMVARADRHSLLGRRLELVVKTMTRPN